MAPMPDKKETAADGMRLREAVKRKHVTARHLAEIGDALGARYERREADQIAQRAEEILSLPEKPAIGTGGELFLSPEDAAEKPGLALTVEDPDGVTVDASRDRLDLTADAHCLALAADAAETIRAENSLEKMLAHQMAAAHAASMRLIGRAEDELHGASLLGSHARHEGQLSATRLLNTAARLMTSFQDGMMALHKMRRGGRQVVTVQHVQVSDGGQAVVAGIVESSGRGYEGGGRGEK